jgi:hypothetical protein
MGLVEIVEDAGALMDAHDAGDRKHRAFWFGAVPAYVYYGADYT